MNPADTSFDASFADASFAEPSFAEPSFADTILAVASPPGRSLRGIVRIAGPRTFDLLHPYMAWSDGHPRRGLHPSRLALRPSCGAGVPACTETAATHQAGTASGPQDCAGGTPVPQERAGGTPVPQERAGGTPVPRVGLPCLALVFEAPASYTGEDGVELLLPGNPVLLERVIDVLLSGAHDRDIDARRAEPGEFTARAFTNGRLSLDAAEGVAATIAARCDAQLEAARHLSSGALSIRVRGLADDLASALALVEAGIDFTDQEDVVPIGPAALLERLAPVHDELASMIQRAVGTESLEAVPWVVLAGAPNAGKSTLFNALLDTRRAVVSDVAGTTRDVIAEPLTLPDHGEVMLVDVAGTDAGGGGALDRAMRARAAEALDRAEVVLECWPLGDDTLPPARPDAPADDRTIIVRTMSDRAGAGSAAPPDAVVVSAVTGAGLGALREALSRRLGARAVSLAADAVVLRPRHEAALAEAREALDAARGLLGSGRDDRRLPDPELIAAAIRSALDALGTVTGAITPDDVLGRVFATFCVGK